MGKSSAEQGGWNAASSGKGVICRVAGTGTNAAKRSGTSRNVALQGSQSGDLLGNGRRHVTSHFIGTADMLNDFTGAERVFIACGYTDLRRGIDGLASLVQSQFQLDPFTNTLFLFCGRRRDRIKALYWEGNGFVLLYKRLESGSFQWPRSEAEARELTSQQYRWLMEGLQIDQPKAHKAVTGLSVI